MKKWLSISLILSILVGCTSSTKLEREISKVEVDVEFALFHDAFFSSQVKDLPNIKEKFPYMFPVQMSDDLVLERKQDTIQQFLYEEVKKEFSDFSSQKEEFVEMFKHIKYYYRSFKMPTIVTDITGVSYNDRVLYANNLLLLSLDMFLGREHEVYGGYPGYLAETFTKEHLVSEVAKKLIDTKYRFTKDRSFLGKFIFEGKKLYLRTLFLPRITDEVLLGYTTEKLAWALKNEAPVWSYFIKNELLYSNDAKLQQRFIDVAPFSKFYMTIDKDSPGGIANYMGLQIVRAYMQKNDISPKELMRMDEQTILSQSGFKPKK